MPDTTKQFQPRFTPEQLAELKQKALEAIAFLRQASPSGELRIDAYCELLGLLLGVNPQSILDEVSR